NRNLLATLCDFAAPAAPLCDAKVRNTEKGVSQHWALQGRTCAFVIGFLGPKETRISLQRIWVTGTKKGGGKYNCRTKA
ncbi:hypothetical protein BaRGS_00000655, partial [Batillaria attramentaria]